MTGKTHDLIGFVSLVTLATISPPQSLTIYTFCASIVGNVVGSLLPDIDDAGNRLWDLLPAGNFVGRILRRVFYHHRTITHSLLGVFLVYKGLTWLLPRILNSAYIDPHIVFISIMVGYIAHLIADMLTKDGVPLLFPFKWYFGIPPLAFLRIRTGSFVENFLVFPGVVIYLIVFVVKNLGQMSTIFNLLRS